MALSPSERLPTVLHRQAEGVDQGRRARGGDEAVAGAANCLIIGTASSLSRSAMESSSPPGVGLIPAAIIAL